MTNVNRIRIVWSGAGVTGGGVSTHHWLGTAVASDVTAFKSFYIALTSQMPNTVTMTIPNGGEVIDDNTGDLVSTWTAGTGGTAVGAAATGYAQGVGARISWLTAGTTGNRRVRGTTFVVPTASAVFDTDGTLKTAVVNALDTAANTLLSDLGAGRMVIVTRQTPAHSGTSHAVTGAVTADTSTWLTTRRT